ncbi:hypothetical protein ACE939_15575 [Aquimarina sp. W85]|uniref:hypothetical protein n=1 Tax=Aquimarina rhodophyticola TaxID=3342246 RepID=UPI0036707A81
MKKIVVIFISLLIFSCTKKSSTSHSLLEYIPTSAQVVIKINDLDQAKSKLVNNSFLKTNDSFELVKYFKALPVIKESITSPSLLCFSPLGKNKFEYTYITSIHDVILKNDATTTKKIEKLTYSGIDFHKIMLPEATFYAVQQDSVLIASSSQLLIENRIRGIKAPKKISEDLKKAYEITDDSQPISILFNGKKLASLYENLLGDTSPSLLANFSGWISLDSSIEQDAIHLDGIAVERDSLSSTIGIFDNTVAQENLISKITPISATDFISYTFDNFTTLKKNLAKAQERDIRDIATDLDEILATTSEIGIITLNKNKVITLTTLNPTVAQEVLQGERTETYRDIEIFGYDNPKALSGILKPLIPSIDTTLYFIYGDFIVFSSSIETLRLMIANIQSQAVLYNQDYYSNALEKLSEASTILTVQDVALYTKKLQEQTRDEQNTIWATVKTAEYKLLVTQLIKEKDFAHQHHIFQKHITKEAVSSVTQVAATTLSNKLLSSPILVKNHRTKGLDIVVQDITNTLYLISAKGTVFWKKQLDGPILGDIQQIDIYKNGRFQLLFNTSNTVYLLDRDGNTVPPYPKKFTESITMPLALFDYDKSKRYRIVIVQKNKVTMFNAQGDVVSGFRFKETKNPVVQTPQHIRIGTKDYILIAETTGKLNILDRLGRQRLEVKESLRFSKNRWYRHNDNFISLDAGGRLTQIDQKGVVSYSPEKYAASSNLVATNKTLVLLSENQLNIKDKTIALDFGVYTAPQLFYINDKIYITITDIQTKKVYLYDSNGELIQNFPIYGVSEIQMGNMDKDISLEIVVQGEDNSILLYQMN